MSEKKKKSTKQKETGKKETKQKEAGKKEARQKETVKKEATQKETGKEEEKQKPETEEKKKEQEEKKVFGRRRVLRILCIVLIVLAALIVAGLVLRRAVGNSPNGMGNPARRGASASLEPAVQTLSAEAENGRIDSVLVGAGTLQDQETEEVNLPDTVEVETCLVSDGDLVEEGDLLATVDRVSVAASIVEVQEALDDVDAALGAEAESGAKDTITASAGGRIKAIYAEEGTSVTDTLNEFGALMLLSLDGLMAVDFEDESGLTAGDSVTVTLSDGTDLAGRVERNLNGEITVTLSDDGPECGETVTVSDGETVLGSGVLYIHSELRVMGWNGIVDVVEVSEEEEVQAGETLLALTDVGESAEFASLLTQRSALEKRMAELFGLYEDTGIYAPCAGVVSGVSLNAGSAGSSSDSVYSVGEQTLLSITPQTVMTIAIQVDELDILQLSEGQSVDVTLDAMTGQMFAGTITGIASEGTNSGGSSKFSVEITLPREEKMLAGMNASVKISVGTAENVLLIPEAALAEENGAVYVYTGWDEKSESLTGRTEVETGVSDGTYVEIRSGISAGDTVYYRYADEMSYVISAGRAG